MLQLAHGFAGVGRNHVDDLIDSGCGPIPFFFGGRHLDAECGLHGEIVDLGFDQFLELAGGVMARF